MGDMGASPAGTVRQYDGSRLDQRSRSESSSFTALALNEHSSSSPPPLPTLLAANYIPPPYTLPSS